MSVLDFSVINVGISSEVVQLCAVLKAERLPGEDMKNNKFIKL